MKKRKIILFTILLLSNSCNETTSVTIALKTVLYEFNTTIPVEKHLYLIIPDFSCSGCVNRTWSFLDSNIDEKDNSWLSIIDGYNEGKDPFIKGIGIEVLIDNDHLIEKIPYNFANPTLLLTKNKRIQSIEPIQSNNIESTLKKHISSFKSKPHLSQKNI